MKTRFFDWKWLVASVVILSGSAYGDSSSNSVVTVPNPFEKSRRELQAQGFKTDLTNFDFSTSPELRSREAILNATAPNRNVRSFDDHPNLVEPAGSNQAIVVWKQDSLKRQTGSWPDASDNLTWDEFAEAINQNQSQTDAACVAILSGPIQFNLDASAGNAMLLRHLPLLKNLTLSLNDRVILAMHEGNRQAAWTNLMAATRLVTAWNPEPVEISHRVRFGNAKLVFSASWQALEGSGWTDEELARLQHEWETADFLGHLPEFQAFRRACDLKGLESDTPSSPIPEGGMFDDESRLLLFYRDREIEFRNAVKAANWMQMRQMPGVTNEVFFHPEFRYRRFESYQNLRQLAPKLAGGGLSLLGQAAETEAERRVIITALAVKRYYGKYKRYPESLVALAPEFLKSVPLDFINSQPLHYRAPEGDDFIVYSVGMDCVDNDGRIHTSQAEERLARATNPNSAVPESDIVWPFAASPAQVAALRKQQTQAEAERQAKRKTEMETEEKAGEEQAEKTRESAIKKLITEKPSLGKEPVYKGKPLSFWVNKIGQIERYNGTPQDAIEAIRAIGPKAVPFLLEWMPHPGAERPVEGFPECEFAWWALGAQGKSAIPTLAHILNEPQHTMDDYSGWTESAKAISYLGPDAIAPMLAVATNMQGRHELWELLHNFENLGTNGGPAVPALIHWANDPDYWVRDGVVSALGGIGKRPDLAVPVLLNALEHDSNSMVRRDAAAALGSFANDSEAVLPELTKTLKDSDWEARGGALTGLGKIQNKPEIVVPLISPFLYDESNSVIQRTAAYALRDLGSEAGYRALYQASNAPSSWPGIGDIIWEVREKNNRDRP
jgi:hypothetical protein